MNTALLYAVLAAVFGGSVPVFSKYGLEVFPPFAMNSLRFFTATLVFLPFMVTHIKTLLHKKVLIASFVALFNPILFIIAINLTKASVAPLIYASVPLMVAIYGRYKGEKLSIKRWTGVIIGFSGVALTVLLPVITSDNADAGNFLGNILIFLAAIIFFAYTQLSKEIQDKKIATPTEVTFSFVFITFLATLPFGIYDFTQKVVISEATPLHLLAGIATGMIGTSIFYLVYQKALQASSALTASLFVFIQPLATAFLAFLVLGETITIPFIIGGVLAIIGAKLASA